MGDLDIKIVPLRNGERISTQDADKADSFAYKFPPRTFFYPTLTGSDWNESVPMTLTAIVMKGDEGAMVSLAVCEKKGDPAKLINEVLIPLEVIEAIALGAQNLGIAEVIPVGFEEKAA